MLAEVGRPALEYEPTFAHHDWTADAGRPLRLDPHAARLELRIGEEIADRVDRSGGHDYGLERDQKVVALPKPRLRPKLALQMVAVRHAPWIGRKARVARHRLEAQH